jgi:transcriptional regulator with XRE-family HTH domain
MRRTSRLSPAFAKLIRKYRLQKGLSQEVLAEAASIHHTYIGLLERGLRKPTLEVGDRLAKALGKTLSALIEEAERAGIE